MLVSAFTKTTSVLVSGDGNMLKALVRQAFFFGFIPLAFSFSDCKNQKNGTK